MEAENKKLRDAAKKNRNEEVRVSYLMFLSCLERSRKARRVLLSCGCVSFFDSSIFLQILNFGEPNLVCI